MIHKTENLMTQRIWQRPYAFFVLAYAWTWFFWVPRALASQGQWHLPADPVVFHIAGAFGPAIAAIFITFMKDGKNGLSKLFAPYRRWRIPWGCYAFVLLTRPLIWLSVLMAYLMLGQPITSHSIDMSFMLLYLLGQLVVVGVGEELGWAGYALPHLQKRFGFLKANLVLGILWGLWHLPFFFTVQDSQYGASILIFVLKLTAFRYLFSLAYVRTGSLLMPALFHVSFNVLTELIPLSPNDPYAIGLSVVLAAAILGFAKSKAQLSSDQRDVFVGERTLSSA